MRARSLHVIACATVIEEMLPHMPPDASWRELDFGLHLVPDELRKRLQEAIDEATADTVVLGYGLCSMAAVGLRANGCTLVVPKVDDCIAIFLGSCAAYQQQSRAEPGTYYLTKGWIEVGDSPFNEYENLVERYGKEDADYVMGAMIGNYRRLAFIDTGSRDQDRYREIARTTAERFGLRYEEIPGSDELIRRTLHGPWGEDFIVAAPGHTIAFEDFRRPEQEEPSGASNQRS
jgi:hypothetical protein